MTDSERETLTDLIDLTIANASMIADLRQSNKALRLFLKNLHPLGFDSRFAGFWADSDGRGEDLYEARLVKVRKLAANRDSLRSTDKGSL